ncbi:hypothetical protein [Alicyclobacillus fodiniaquatilis]|jgi:hypothetical protein|uniref:Uncharacterized protein n=1 Tax=Alicyclobacillus fodiniaquatilis TaxID=1661150 RepID=A0ABW4JIT5_9BACL
MSDLKDQLKQRLVRSRSVHQELIQAAPAPPVPDDGAVNDAPAPVSPANSPGRPRKVKRKITTLYFDEDLDKALELFLLQQYLQSGSKISKSEWIRNLVEESLRKNDAWPRKS